MIKRLYRSGGRAAQGDLDDRKKIKDADVRKEKEARAQREADDRALEARKLAGMGYSLEEIEAELARSNMVRRLHTRVFACMGCSVWGFFPGGVCIRGLPP